MIVRDFNCEKDRLNDEVATFVELVKGSTFKAV